MVQQYLRTVTVSVDEGSRVYSYGREPGGNGLRIRFVTQQFVSGTPANIRVLLTNVSKDTSSRFIQKEYRKISLLAGYGGNEALIFRGEIVQARRLRESVTDTVLEITATSNETARNYAVVNKALASGHTHDDRIKIAVDAFRQFGVEPGRIDSLGGPKFPRNFVAFGMAHDLLREICTARQASWFIHEGRLNVLKNENTMSSSGAIVLNSDSGLVGLAEQTIEGVQFTALLNPSIVPGCKVQIDESSITRAQYDPAYSAAARNALLEPGGVMGVAADGFYKVLKVAHEGDTRGNAFFTHGVGVKLDSDSAALRAIGISDDIPS